MKAKRQVVIYSAKADLLDDEMLYEGVRAYVSSERLRRAQRMYREQDRRLSILSEVLVSYAYSVQGLDPHPVILTGEHGKPYDRDDRLHFNASHSGNRVILAVTDHAVEIGCDLQEISKCDLRIAERMFTKEDAERLAQVMAGAEDEKEDILFTKMWTRKESFLKCIGVGLSASNSQPDDRFRFSELDDFEGYQCTVCLETDQAYKTEIVEVTKEILRRLLSIEKNAISK